LSYEENENRLYGEDKIMTTMHSNSIQGPSGGYRNVQHFKAADSSFRTAGKLPTDVSLAISGYSSAPADYDGYEGALTTLLSHAINEDVGVITSSTTGSVETAATRVATENHAPVVHVTCERYLQKYTPNVEDFPKEIQSEMADIPKLVLPDKEAYLKGAIDLSNSTLIFGGRGAAVGDFKESVEKGNPVVIAVDLDAPEFRWDTYGGDTPNVPSNASQYLADQLSDTPSLREPEAFVESIEDEWIVAHSQQLKSVKMITFHSHNPVEVEAAGHQVHDFLMHQAQHQP
jgi:hypothetical protein